MIHGKPLDYFLLLAPVLIHNHFSKRLQKRIWAPSTIKPLQAHAMRRHQPRIPTTPDIMSVTFDYCALHFLNQWLRDERACYKALQAADEATKLEKLQRALHIFKVDRKAPTKHDTEIGLPRYKPALDIIEQASRSDFNRACLTENIEAIADKLAAAYGGNKSLSFTTKLLWLKFRSPIVIYDGKARNALNCNKISLADYYSRWHDTFKQYRLEIDSACSALINARQYCRDQRVATPEYIRRVSSEKWFQARVFDIYLWHSGKA